MLSTHQFCTIGTLLWSVSKSTLDQQLIRKNLVATRERSSFPLFLPTGVSIQEMEKVWHDLQFNPAAPTEVPFKAKLFRPAPRSIQLLRRLSQQGRDYLERAMCEQKDKPKLVWGLPNDAQVIAPLVALAHGPTESRGPEDVQGLVGLSDVQTGRSIIAEATNQHASTTTQATSADAVPLATPSALETNISDGDDHFPDATIAHLEDMLSEDQKRIAEDQAAFSAIQSRRARSMLSCRPYTHPGATERHSKSHQLITHPKRHLREAETFDRPALVTREERVHRAEGMGHKAAAS
jgi:hypothetical protein